MDDLIKRVDAIKAVCVGFRCLNEPEDKEVVIQRCKERIQRIPKVEENVLDKIKTDIENAKGDFNEYNDYQIGVRQGFRFALEIIGNYERGEGD